MTQWHCSHAMLQALLSAVVSPQYTDYVLSSLAGTVFPTPMLSRVLSLAEISQSPSAEVVLLPAVQSDGMACHKGDIQHLGNPMAAYEGCAARAEHEASQGEYKL